MFGADQAARHAKDRFRSGENQQIARAAPRHVHQQLFERIAARYLHRRPGRSGRLLLDHFFDFAAIQLLNELIELRVPNEFCHASPLFCYRPEVFSKGVTGRT